MSFFNRTLDWFQGMRSSHMGPDQYVAHNGKDGDIAMSGPLLWSASEAETICKLGNMVNAETKLISAATEEIANEIPKGTSVVELGPGTEAAFFNKTLPLVRRLQSKSCVLVDESTAFLEKLISSPVTQNLPITPVIDNFFETEYPYLQHRALICSFGSTISNFEGPLSQTPPLKSLTNGLASMANAVSSGWLLVGFDSDHNEEHLKAFYSNQSLFQLNIFYRMATEFGSFISGDFDPRGLDYEPYWISSSGQLAHIAVVKRDMDFSIRNTAVSLKKGRKLHIKNSYKYTPDFFERCCNLAGLDVIRNWSDDSPAKLYLLRIRPRKFQLRSWAFDQFEHEEALQELASLSQF
jgi:uncharacterized SAM-dependent methyltransferase